MGQLSVNQASFGLMFFKQTNFYKTVCKFNSKLFVQGLYVCEPIICQSNVFMQNVYQKVR